MKKLLLLLLIPIFLFSEVLDGYICKDTALVQRSVEASFETVCKRRFYNNGDLGCTGGFPDNYDLTQHVTPKPYDFSPGKKFTVNTYCYITDPVASRPAEEDHETEIITSYSKQEVHCVQIEFDCDCGEDINQTFDITKFQELGVTMSTCDTPEEVSSKMAQCRQLEGIFYTISSNACCSVMSCLKPICEEPIPTTDEDCKIILQDGFPNENGECVRYKEIGIDEDGDPTYSIEKSTNLNGVCGLCYWDELLPNCTPENNDTTPTDQNDTNPDQNETTPTDQNDTNPDDGSSGGSGTDQNLTCYQKCDVTYPSKSGIPWENCIKDCNLVDDNITSPDLNNSDNNDTNSSSNDGVTSVGDGSDNGSGGTGDLLDGNSTDGNITGDGNNTDSTGFSDKYYNDLFSSANDARKEAMSSGLDSFFDKFLKIHTIEIPPLSGSSCGCSDYSETITVMGVTKSFSINLCEHISYVLDILKILLKFVVIVTLIYSVRDVV
jgi:hypothetical protein